MTPFVLLKWYDPQTQAPIEAYLPLPVVIGRGSRAGLALDDNAVSRRHVLLALSRQGLMLRDLNSANGTFLNSQPMSYGHLQAGDRLRIGRCVLRVARLGAERHIKQALIVKGAPLPDVTTLL